VARRVFLHVGTPKSGTTYLQSLWWSQRDALAERGLLLPGRTRRDHVTASHLVCERTSHLAELTPRRRRTWDRLLAETADWDGDALVSHEMFAPASRDRAAGALGRLGEVADEVHLVLTARDLARQLASDWQQNVKQGRPLSLRQMWQMVQHETSGWWAYQDLADLLERWGQGVPVGRRHLVVLPPSGGATTSWLWDETCRVLGLDAHGLSSESREANVSIGLVETEVLRRVNALVPEADRTLDLRRFTKGRLTSEVLVGLAGQEAFSLPRDIHHETAARARAMVAAVDGRAHVVGDLSHLVPDPEPVTGRRTPEDVTEEEVAAATTLAMTRLVLLAHRLTR
jgi:hypothetical protein